MYTALKLTIIIFWLAFAYNFFFPLVEPYSSIVTFSGLILALVHVIEFALKKAQLDARDAGGIHGFCQTLLFGFLYWLAILKK